MDGGPAQWRGWFSRYSFPVIAAAAITVVRVALEPVLGGESPFLVYTLAVGASAWWGRLWAGLLATALSVAASLFFVVRPHMALTLPSVSLQVQTVVFLVTGAVVSWLTESLHRARAGVEQAEREVRLLNADLERRVDDRTRALSEANAELEAFAYSVAHDLRAPVRNMHALATALAEDYGDHLPDEARDFTRRIVAAAVRLDTLIQDLLAYARLSREELRLQPLDLDGLVTRVLAHARTDLEERQADVRVARPLGEVLAHRATLEQMVTNLVDNAVKFVAPGTRPVVYIHAEQRADRVRLWVEDNGLGIAPEHQDRIFRVFERLHAQEVYPGTGIGLAIVRKGAERMGGACGVVSEPGRGSRFWLELPKRGAA